MFKSTPITSWDPVRTSNRIKHIRSPIVCLYCTLHSKTHSVSVMLGVVGHLMVRSCITSQLRGQCNIFQSKNYSPLIAKMKAYIVGLKKQTNIISS